MDELGDLVFFRTKRGKRERKEKVSFLLLSLSVCVRALPREKGWQRDNLVGVGTHLGHLRFAFRVGKEAGEEGEG